MRTIAIPRCRAPEKLIDARSKRHGDAYPCIVCGLPAPNPKFMIHVVNGGGEALPVADEPNYVADGGDMGLYPIGPECARKFPELKPCLHKTQ